VNELPVKTGHKFTTFMQSAKMHCYAEVYTIKIHNCKKMDKFQVCQKCSKTDNVYICSSSCYIFTIQKWYWY